MLVELERLVAPTSPAEEALNGEIRGMRFYSIRRAPDDQIAYMRMKPQQCHQNAASYARLDPSGESRHVSGWWKRGGIFYFHSVILSRTRLSCITPHRDGSAVQFAPDFDIAWKVSGEVMNASRRGEKVPYLVRDFPDRVIEEAEAARNALLGGADPNSIKIAL